MALHRRPFFRRHLPVSVAWLCAALVSTFIAADPAHAEGRWPSWLGGGLVGSGKVVEQARPVANFTALRSEGSVDVLLSQGPATTVLVRTDDNLQEHLQTVVEERDGRPTLVVRWKGGTRLSSSTPTQVRVQVPELQHISSHGSGDIEFEAFKAGTLAISVHGSGDVRAARLQVQDLQLSLFGSADARLGGQADRLDLQIRGSGDVKAEPLQAAHVKVSIRGSGSAWVTAERSLAVNIAGSGDVSYAGQPAALSSSVAGSGHVRKR